MFISWYFYILQTSVTDYSEDDSVHQDGANTSGDSGYNDPTQNVCNYD